jgi:hypothetical protein
MRQFLVNLIHTMLCQHARLSLSGYKLAWVAAAFELSVLVSVVAAVALDANLAPSLAVTFCALLMAVLTSGQPRSRAFATHLLFVATVYQCLALVFEASEAPRSLVWIGDVMAFLTVASAGAGHRAAAQAVAGPPGGDPGGDPAVPGMPNANTLRAARAVKVQALQAGPSIGRYKGQDIPSWVQDASGTRYEFLGLGRIPDERQGDDIWLMPGLLYRKTLAPKDAAAA